VDLFTSALLATTAIYCCVALSFLVGLFRVPQSKSATSQPPISVVIAARNEATFIGALLDDLRNQTYPTDRFEVLVVNDASTDETAAIVNRHAEQHANVQLLHVGDAFPQMAAKKRPMSVGLQAAQGEWIVTTDADCRVPPTWLAAMATYMHPNVGAIVGFSQLKTPNADLSPFERLQAFDFLTLMGAAAGAVGIGFPLAASGQNLAYRKSLFERVGGFQSIAHRPSGDDVLLLQLLRRARGGRIGFAIAPESFVSTWRSETPSSFWQQRRRWASNAIVQLRLNPAFFAYIACVFAANGLILFGLIAATITGKVQIPLACWFAKAVIDLLMAAKAAHVFGRADLLVSFFLWEILQAPYTVCVGLLGTLRGFTWKERRHR